VAGLIGIGFLAVMLLACLGSLPWTLGPGEGQREGEVGLPRYNLGEAREGRLPPWWWPAGREQALRFNAAVPEAVALEIASRHGMSVEEVRAAVSGPAAAELRDHWPRFWLGSDVLGRSVLIRSLAGGAISLGIGLSAALLSVFIGTLYGTISAYAGGRVDGVMMRIVDVLYGLPYILLVVLLAVAVDALVERRVAARVESASQARSAYVERALSAFEPDQRQDPALVRQIEAEAMQRIGSGELGAGARNAINVVTLLVAIGGVSWLTMARVIRGQVLSLKEQPFIEAARALGAGWGRIFVRHLLPNLVGPIVVYATLTVPQAILQESFLSFLGIGVKPPLPSWGNLAAEGLVQLNPYQSHWWLLLFPCVLLGVTLLALNFVGEGLREAFDPKRARR
jgi:ABC-type dipeptide/oligopeptide/nickel transport system permease subunit